MLDEIFICRKFFESKQGRRFTTLAAALAVGLLTIAAGELKSVAIDMTTIPDQTTLAPGEETLVLLKIVNNGTAEWKGELRVHSPRDLVTQVQRSISGIAGGTSLLIPVKIAAAGDDLASGSVLFWLDGNQPAASPATNESAFASIQVAPTMPAATKGQVEIKTKIEGSSFDEYRESRLHLIITNNSTATLTGASATPVQNDSLEIVEAPPTATERLDPIHPGAERAFRFRVRAHDDAPRGQHLIAINVDIEWSERGLKRAQRRYVTQEVTVGSAGTSEILAIFEIPSLLLLPGFLFVVTFFYLSGNSKEQELIQKAKNPAIWILSISLSLVAAFSYPLLTGVFLGRSRNFLRGYGLIDVLYLWTLAVGCALAFAAAFRLWPSIRRWLWEIQPEATPIVALRKAALAAGQLEQVQERQHPDLAYYLYSTFNKAAWIAPRIRWQWTDTKSEHNRNQLAKAIEATFERAPWPIWSWRLWRLSRKMAAAQKQGRLQLWWDIQDGVALKPIQVLRDQISVTDSTSIFCTEGNFADGMQNYQPEGKATPVESP